MAAAAMSFVTQTVGAFRTAAELSSHEPAQLKRTIEELSARIDSQDVLIEQQLQYIHELEAKQDIQPQPAQKSTKSPDSFALLSEISDLRERNKRLEEAQDRLQDGFDSLFDVQLDNLSNSLEVLEKLNSSPEARSLYTRVKKQSQAIARARDLGQASPLNALRQMADLEREIVCFITDRPLLTFTRLDSYRAETLISALDRDRRPLSTTEASRIIGEAEGKSIDRKQALRAMRWAANYHPDQAKFELRGAKKKAWLCKIANKEAHK